MSRRRSLISVLALPFGCAMALHAQDPAPPRLEPGRFVRVTVASGPAAESFRGRLPVGVRHEGTFLGMSGDSIRFRPSAPASASVTFPPAAIDRIEVAAGRRSNALRGLLIGAGVGFALGALTGGTCQSSYVCEPGAGSAMAYGLALGSVFGLAGAGIGALTSSTRWVAVPTGPLPPSDSEREGNR